MKILSLALILIFVPITHARAATPTYYIEGLFRQANDALARAYLKVTNNVPLRVTEQDGSPNVTTVTTIKVSNGTLTDNGSGTVSIITGGSSSGDVFQLINPVSSGTNFIVDFNVPAQAFVATGAICFRYSTNWLSTNTSKGVSIFIPATNYARRVSFTDASTNWGMKKILLTVPFGRSAKIDMRLFGLGETNVSFAFLLDENFSPPITERIDPTAISGLRLWIRPNVGNFTDWLGAIPAMDNDGLRLILDSSGSGNRLTNATGSINTRYYGPNTSPFNIPSFALLPATPSGQSKLTSATFAALAQPNWVFVVYYSTLGGNPVFDTRNTGSRTGCFPSFNGTTLQLFAGSSLSTAAPLPTYWTLFSFKANGANSIIRTNGVQAVTGNAGAGTIGGFTFAADAAGTATVLEAYVGEMLVYNANLSDANRDAIENYLREKYSLW